MDSLTPASLLPFVLVGFLGGPHCVGMCGGIVAALAAGSAPGRRGGLHLAYNLGRISAYVAAGALLGALGGWLGAGGQSAIAAQWPVRTVLFLLANLLLVGMGLYLLGLPQLLLPLERGGQRLWRRIQPLTRHFLPVRSPLQALPLGFLWGFLPCGLVYSALASALASGSAAGGAAILLAFGLGTLPNLLAIGLLAVRLKEWARHPVVRRVAGSLVLAYGAWGLFAAVRLLAG
ncbi:hypothetical protein OTERR_08350 [Oryzomicrobium terrae]|uniref:Urease accessory protein UreH-like transmembrane domain-containing protein n=1 Tax=Oryzomicrobium terrae TaxID=1735038 RepID=A0A5C1E5V7_9RHOO|nr:hypothetical protein OTERR_08350 [Oryzomicrobium terrae]